MELKKVVSGIENIKAKGNLDIKITEICNNSKDVKEGSMFVAIKGFEVDGHSYVQKAIEQGASCIMVEDVTSLKSIEIPETVTILVVPNTRLGLSLASSNFYGNPSKKMKLIGITGTKGKTTTSYMTKAILEKAGMKVGLIGTIATYINGEKIKENERTTPESIELQELMARMVKEEVEVCIMEVSSQSLKLDRVAGCDFDIGVFTNFSKDHISSKEHPDMEDYFASKVKLFQMCQKGYINSDDYMCAKVPKMLPNCNIKTYGIDNPCDLLAKDISVSNKGSDFKAKLKDRNDRIKVAIPGRFSIYNSLAAVAVTKDMGIKPEDIKEALETVVVPGRSELIPNKKGLSVMIDYAHSPESLQSILKAVGSYTSRQSDFFIWLRRR